MSEDEDKATRYDEVWNRVKVYIPFLQELISFYKNDTHQNRQQQLQKIITIYDLLTNQRLNYLSLCKCEKVLIKLYETNPLRKDDSTASDEAEAPAKKPSDGDSPESPGNPDAQSGLDLELERGTEEDAPVASCSRAEQPLNFETETPASPCGPESPDTPAEPDSPAAPDTPPELDIPPELDSPAIPDTPAEPDEPTEPIRHAKSNPLLDPLSPDSDSDEYWDDPKPKKNRNTAKKPPLSLDEITRLITSDSKHGGSNSRNSGNNSLSKVINDTLKVFQKPTFDERARNPSPPYENVHLGRNPNVPFPPNYPTHNDSRWEAENDAFGVFPHPVTGSYRNFPNRNSDNVNLSPRPQSPPLYRRRDDVKRFHDDRMEISPTYSSPSDRGGPSGLAPAVNMKDPRIRKAVESNMHHVPSPEILGPDRPNPFFPVMKPNDPRLNRANPPMPPAPTPNELPRCVAPNPNLPLDLPKKDPPKRRLSICANQVIIEEIPPEPVLLPPPRSFPPRRQSICGDFNGNRNDEPFHGTSFLPSQPPLPPPMGPQPMPPPLMPPPHSPHPHQHPPHSPHPHSPHPMLPPQQPIPVLVNRQAFDVPSVVPSVVDRDPRRKPLPPGADYMPPMHHQSQNQHPPMHQNQPPQMHQQHQNQQPPMHHQHQNQQSPMHHQHQNQVPQMHHQHQNQQPPNRFQHGAPPGPSKAPLTYLEYRRQKELNQQNNRNQNQPKTHGPKPVSKDDEPKSGEKQPEKQPKQSEEMDITIGMVPNKNRVAAKAYAKPAKFVPPKERQFSKDKPRTDSKHTSKSHKHESSSSSSSSSRKPDKKRDESVEKDKVKSAPKVKDLFGEQLSQFDKMYRSGDFSKKAAAPSSGIGGFKIPKIKKVEKPSSATIVKPAAEEVPRSNERKDKSKSKSPEPPKASIADDDDMWDDEPAGATKQPSKEAPKEKTTSPKEAPKKKTTPPKEVPKEKTTPLNSLDDDDFWDSEPTMSGPVSTPEPEVPAVEAVATTVEPTTEPPAAAATESKPSKVAGEDTPKEAPRDKPLDVFQVPSLPAPRRIMRRRNSVAVQPNEMQPKTPAPVFSIPGRITRRRASVAVSYLEDDSGRNAEKVEKELPESKKEVKKTETKKTETIEQKEQEDIFVRPRRACKRKPIIEDDDEDATSGDSQTNVEPKEQKKPSKSSTATTKDTTVQKAAETVPAKEESDNVVSSTTSESTAKKRRRTRKGKGAMAVANKEDESPSDTSQHDQSAEAELPTEASSSADDSAAKDEKPVDIKVEPCTSEEMREAKEAKENKEMVEGLLKGSTDPDNKAKLLEMLSKILDEKKLQKIKEIIDSPSDKTNGNETEESPAETPEAAEGNRERTASTSVSSTIEASEKRKGKKSELDKLNEDIAEMYIRDGVLSATGRRSCTKRQVVRASPVKRAAPRKSAPAAVLVRAPTAVPVRDPAPAPPPASAPAKPLASAPAKPPASAPAKPPASAPAPAKPPASAPAKPPVSAPAKPAASAPAKPPASAPIKSPAPTPAPSPAPAPAPVVISLRKGMEFKLTDKVPLKRLRVAVQKIDLSKTDLLLVNSRSNTTIHGTEDDLLSIASSSATSLSPRSKKKKRPTWASGTVPKRKKKAEPSSPPKTYAPKPVTKNVNKDLHCQSDKSKDCALCSYVGPLSGIVQHYVRSHPLHEVYVSRIPNEIAVKLKKEPLAVTGTMHDQNITFKCIFCQQVLSKKKYNWKLHLASHTGEYRYKCNNCTIKSLAPSTSAHDSECIGPAMDVTNDVMFTDNHLHGFMCRVCNFVQMSRPKVDAHMREEHDRNFTNKGILRFSILNYAEPLEAKSSETLESDISMPELTPQVTIPSKSNMSAFIPSAANDEIESLLTDRTFVSPSKPSIIDKLKENFDEIMRKDAAAKASKGGADDDEWEDIESPPKRAQPKSSAAKKRADKAKRSLTGSGPGGASEDIPMPTPLDMKKEVVDVFEHKQAVANVGFSKTGDKIWYLCLIGDCKYATEARSEMYAHVAEQHESIVWDGYCYLCTAQVSNEESSVLAKEVKHMAVIHIKDRSAFEELIEQPQAGPSGLADIGSMLKLRRFSGDKLSIGMAEEPINLKPWLQTLPTKNRAHCLNMLEHKSLFCFYKCMGESCCFTTTIETQMEKHIDNHELVGDIAGTETTKSWLECAYCDVITEGKIDLLRHLRLVHAGSAYQCAYCFYRSREAYNVVLHQKLHHEKEKTAVLVYDPDKRPLTPADYDRLNRRPVENIMQLICTVCNAEYCVLDAYMAHLKDDHADVTTITCQCCKETIQKLKIPRHLLQHNIGIYECIYCQFGSNTMEAVQIHVCNRHPQEPLFCCIRYNKTPGKVKEASLKSLYEMSVEEGALVHCNLQLEELNYKSPDTKSNHDINFTAKPGVIPLQLPPIRIGDTNIFLSAQIPSSSSAPSLSGPSTTDTSNQSVVVTAKSAEIIKMPMIASVSGGVSLTGASTVPIITAVQGNYQEPVAPAPAATTSATGSTPSIVMPVISHVVGGANVSNMPIITRVEGGVADVAQLKPASSLVGTKIIISPNKGGSGFPIITNVCSIAPSTTQQVQAPKEDDHIMLEAERIAMEMIKDTGLPKNVIYKCIFKGCNSVLPDGTGMRKHLTFSHLPAASYICAHCKGKPSFPNVMSFTQHLKTHEAQRIFCFLCDYKGSFPPEVIKHVKDVHKTSKPTILFLNPKKNDPNNDIILFAPGITTDAERKAYYRKLIDLYNHKLQAALIHLKTHFAPEECESLPKQAIFSQTVFCSKCQYSTKVRLNMYRHLKGHLNDIPVSNMDPKNPVPCWGQGEKHFDRMRNPAASSQEDDDLIQSLCFVQENKRFICGAPDCRYLTINEGMLKNHLSTLHMDVKEYKCPHCPAVHIFSGQLNVGKVLEHLKLHDKELYRCGVCSIFMNKRKELEQHVEEKHPAQNAAIYVIRDGSTAGSAAIAGVNEDGVVFKWKCDVCKFKSPTLPEMRSHMQETHNITSKYRCSRCLYSCSNKSLFTIHFEKQHPGCDIVIISLYKAIQGDDSLADTTPLWRRETSKTRSIRGIMVEDEDEDEDELATTDIAAMPVDLLPGPSGVVGGITRKRRSTETDEAEVSPKRAKEDDSAAAVRAFKCGFKGCSYVNDFGAGIVSHFRTAHPNEKPSVLRNALANPEQSRFDYFMKYACFYCVKKADTVQDLVMHWRQMHKIAGRRSQDKPFLFRASKIILCFYCRKGAVMPEMKSHFTSYHPGNQPIYLDFRNPKRCAECDFTMGTDKQEMVRHFDMRHRTENEYASGWIDFLTDDVVEKILQLNSVIYRCEKCDFSTDNKTDFTIHYATKHPGLRVEFNEYEMEKTITFYCAFNNCQTSSKSTEYLAQHILNHVPLFKCMCDTVQCSAQFRSFVMLLQHFNTTHPQQDLQYALKTPEEYKAVLRSINIQFWNGFMMTLDDARRAGNRYGSHDYFFKHIDDLCAKSVATALQTTSVVN